MKPTLMNLVHKVSMDCTVLREQTAGVTRRGVLFFIALGVAWGIPYALIKIAVVELSPQMLVLVRTGLAALLLLPLAAWRRDLGPALRRWKPLVAYTVFEIIGPWYFINSAEQRLPSSLVGLLIAAVPIVGVVVGLAMGRSERLSRINRVGLLVGLAGVGCLVGFEIGGSDLVGVVELTLAVIGYAIGPAILAHSMADVPALGVVSLPLAGAALTYVPIVLLTDGLPSTFPSAQVVWAVVVLAVVSSAVAFLLMVALVAEIGPVRMTAVSYVNPAVAIAVGALWLGEAVTTWTVVGFVLVLLGSYLVNRRVSRRQRPRTSVRSGATPGRAETDPAPAPAC